MSVGSLGILRTTDAEGRVAVGGLGTAQSTDTYIPSIVGRLGTAQSTDGEKYVSVGRLSSGLGNPLETESEQSWLVQCGMLAAVHEIHDQTKGEPDCETHPGLPIQTANQNEAENDRADRRERYARGAEAAVCVRLGLTHPQNARGHDDERGQRTDVHQFEQYVDVDETAGDGR